MEETTNSLVRPGVPEIDEILGRRFAVLDDGFVRAVDYMGGDRAIVQAARVSYGDGTKHVREDRALIRYLLRHAHTTPFEMCELKVHLRVPMDTWRQWIRHRTANVNEYSTRYSLAIDATQVTSSLEWRRQDAQNRQGSSGLLDSEVGEWLTSRENEVHQLTRKVYEERIAAGVAREQARKDLPLCTYTEAYWKIDLHNLFNFLWLRSDSHAQFEIRQYAHVIGSEIVARWCPIAWEAFTEYRSKSTNLSALEVECVRSVLGGDLVAATKLAVKAGWLNEQGIPAKSRERGEFEAKAEKLGVRLPWIP